MKQESLPLGGGIKDQVDSNTSRITSLETNANKLKSYTKTYSITNGAYSVNLSAALGNISINYIVSITVVGDSYAWTYNIIDNTNTSKTVTLRRTEPETGTRNVTFNIVVMTA